MIIDVNGKRIVFEMLWHPRLSEGDVHRDARAAKSPFLWHADKAFYYGVLNENDSKEKLKAPLYAGAVALMHRWQDVANLVLVLEAPGVGFILCAIHQGRPKSGMDRILATQVEVAEVLADFKSVCGSTGFKLYGDIKLPGMDMVTMEDIVASLDSSAQLRRVKSALINPLAFLATGTVVVLGAMYGYHAYSQYRAAEAQKKAMAAQKNSQQLYNEELTSRRLDASLNASALSEMVSPTRGLTLSIGGWTLQKVTCNVPAQKQIVCTYNYSRGDTSSATYSTFVSTAKDFDTVEFAGDNINATKIYKSLPFIELGKAIDAAKSQRDETIEFGSKLQRLSSVGKSKLDAHTPYGVPPAANVAELTIPPIGSAKWEFAGPLRSAKEFSDAPDYATITQVVINFSGKPAYEIGHSMAMMTVSGTIFSKPN